MPYKPRNQICIGCGKEYLAKDHRTKYCTHKCYAEKAVGEHHSRWKGSNVGIDALHTYMRKNIPKPIRCQCCNKEKPRDLANVSGEYKRESSDWEWLCRKCHMIKDGRLENFIESAPRTGSAPNRKEQICLFCKSLFKPKRKIAKYCSSICSGRHRTQQTNEKKNIPNQLLEALDNT